MKRRQPDLSETLKQQFKKDIELFEYFLVLLNDSSPIRNVELMWADDLELFDPTQPMRVNTRDALVELKPVAVNAQENPLPSPSTHFCDLVHGFGANEEQTCARSDKPAKARCRESGCSQVYPCHVGLTDIAVPVLSEGRYLGTLFSGQVLTEVPTAEGFQFVKESLAEQRHIDLAQLEEAYYRVPVVSKQQLSTMVRMLEVFARYLGNAWKRLEVMSEFQRVREREVQLDRRELAEMLLAAKGQIGGRADVDVETLKNLARNTGLDKLPDRILVLRLLAPRKEDGEQHESERQSQLGGQLTLARVAHLIEDRCRSWANSFAATVGPAEICIFTAQKSRSMGQERLLLDEMAQAILRTARSEGLTSSKIGVSAAHPDSTELLCAYHEAAAAIDAGQSAVNWFETMPERRQQPVQSLAQVLKAVESTDPAALAIATREFLAAAAPSTNNTVQLQQSRGLLTWGCEHLALELATLGAASETVNVAKERAVQIIVGAQSSFTMAEGFRNYVEQLRQLVEQLFSQREEKIVLETQRMIREQGPEKVSIHDLAKNLKISAGHLGRVYSRTTGQTLEEYLIRQRLEMGKRLLLDPRLQVAEVAYLCGFCNPAYFSSVFKKHMNCTPRAYARQPQRWGAAELEPQARG
jgi:AraC-like DNA-binding protein/ligand-binding sensor protein